MRRRLLIAFLLPACATARAQPDAGVRPPPGEDAARGDGREPGRPPLPPGPSDGARPGPVGPDLAPPPVGDGGRPPAGATPPDAADPARSAALAESQAGRGDVAGALASWGAYVATPDLRDHERGFARLRAEELAARLHPDAALGVWEGGTPFVRAAVGPRAAISLRARGDGERARRVEAEAAALRRTLGWTEVASWVGTGDPRRLGLAVPLSGRTAIVGEEVLRGAMMALGEGMAGPDGAPAFELAVRDTAPERDTQGRAAEELVRAEAVVGLLGGGEAATVADAAQDGVPLLSLTDVPPGSATTAFQVIHAAEARAAELARRAAALGARSFAILGPDSASGKRLAEAFAAAVRAQGGRVVAQVTYVAGTTSFGAPIGQLKRAPFDALFVPDDASRLELVAPALAFADVTVQPSAAIAAPGERGTPGARGGARRGVLLLSTARALSRQLLRNSGRYVQGALLAPGFFPAAGDPRAGGFVGRFRDLFGKEPTAIEAYSYDAVRMMTALVERGARTRSDLLRMLQTQGFEGITGTFRFGPDHGRLDPPPVYVVEGDEIKALR